jgi:hypothetical protein
MSIPREVFRGNDASNDAQTGERLFEATRDTDAKLIAKPSAGRLEKFQAEALIDNHGEIAACLDGALQRSQALPADLLESALKAFGDNPNEPTNRLILEALDRRASKN